MAVVRETEDVTSKILRHIVPNEVVIQRGMSVEVSGGLVRIPVQPEGWTTVHARKIGGPTFLEQDGAVPTDGQLRPGAMVRRIADGQYVFSGTTLPCRSDHARCS